MLKKLSLLLGLLLILATANAQSPTLGVGLEALTMSKGTIDVQALTEIIMEKQAQLKNEALKRFMLKMFPETNYTTKFYIQHCLQILLNEKNPQVIEKEIYELTTNYALTLGVAKVFALKNKGHEINSVYEKFKAQKEFKASGMLEAYKHEKFKNLVQENAEKKLEIVDGKIEDLIVEIGTPEKHAEKREKEKKAVERHKLDSIRDSRFKELANLEKYRVGILKKVVKEKIKAGLVNEISPNEQSIGVLPFGLWMDLVSRALSDNRLLNDKGFFRKKIYFEEDRFYQSLSMTDKGKILRDSLKGVVKMITAEIEPYLTHYSIIQTYYGAITKKDGDTSIRSTVTKSLLNSFKGINENDLKDFLGEPTFNKFSAIKTFLKNINGEDEKIKKVDYIHKALNSLVTLSDSYRPLDSQIKVIKTKYDSIRKSYPALNLDADIQLNPFYSDTSSIFKSIPDSKTLITSLNTLRKSYAEQTSWLRSLDSNFKVLRDSSEIKLKELNLDPTQLSALALNAGHIDLDNYKTLIESYGKIKLGAGQKSEVIFNQFGESKDFFKAILTKISTDLTSSLLLPKTTALSEENKEFYKDYTALLSSTYLQINKLLNADSINVQDVIFFEEKIIPEFLRLGAALSLDSDKLNKGIQSFNVLSKMLKVQSLTRIPTKFSYNSSLLEVLKFVSNLGNLDEAETYQDMLNMFDHANDLIIENLGDEEFKKTYVLFSNSIKKYTLVNSSKQSVEIDVVSFLNELQNFYGHNNHSILGLYMTLGLNQNFFFRKVSVPGEIDEIKNIGFASEKLGLKLRFNKIKNLNGLENSVLSDVNLNTNAPFINEWYGIVYGSGLLYSLANTSTTKNFDYPHAGIGTGIRFYNALDLNFVVGIPFIKNQSPFRNMFVGLGLDIPLGEYLEKIGNKK